MHGGNRLGAGRKPLEMTQKKKPITIYLNEEEMNYIAQIPLPLSHNFSQRCRTLIHKGIDSLQKDLSTDEHKITYIDLFCGLGGIRIGFEQALKDKGITGQCVFSSDIKLAATKAYSANFGDDPLCDITKVNPESLPNFDFLLAGFPCQAFSQAGLGLGFNDTRGTLFFDIAKILSCKKPKGFILENVEGLVSHDHGKTFKIILSTLNELGYSVQYNVLDGKDFGLAQSRKRIYIVGLHNTEMQPLDYFEHRQSVLSDIIDYRVKAKRSDFTKKLLAHFPLETTYGKAIKDKRGGSNNIHSWDIGLKGEVSKDQKILLDKLLHQRRNKKWADVMGVEWMDGMPLPLNIIQTFYDHPQLFDMLTDLVNKGYLVFEHPKKKEAGRRVYDESLPKGYNIVTGKLSFEFTKILSPHEVTPTIVATDVHKLAVPVHGGIRPLTITEGLALFGFPSDYQLDFIKESEAFDLLGNTVCVPVIKAVSQKMLESYEESHVYRGGVDLQ